MSANSEDQALESENKGDISGNIMVDNSIKPEGNSPVTTGSNLASDESKNYGAGIYFYFFRTSNDCGNCKND